MNTISPITQKLLPYSFLKGVGPVTLKKIAGHAGFNNETESDVVSRIPAIYKALDDSNSWSSALEKSYQQIKLAEDKKAFIVSILDDCYPKNLPQTKDDPSILFVLGSLDSLSEKSVAVIGTRKPTDHGKIITLRITSFLVENGWIIVSGLALGCDAIAHQATVDSNGRTVAVLAHGLHTIAPSQNSPLAEKILQSGGALVSEFPFGVDPVPPLFVKRDKTQAGLSKGVIMIQSDLKGGSLHASRSILEYGRCLAVPYPTEFDLNSNDPKIQANVTLASGDNQKIKELMRCKDDTIHNLIVIRSKNDYSLLIDRLAKKEHSNNLFSQ